MSRSCDGASRRRRFIERMSNAEIGTRVRWNAVRSDRDTLRTEYHLDTVGELCVHPLNLCSRRSWKCWGVKGHRWRYRIRSAAYPTRPRDEHHRKHTAYLTTDHTMLRCQRRPTSFKGSSAGNGRPEKPHARHVNRRASRDIIRLSKNLRAWPGSSGSRHQPARRRGLTRAGAVYPRLFPSRWRTAGITGSGFVQLCANFSLKRHPERPRTTIERKSRPHFTEVGCELPPLVLSLRRLVTHKAVGVQIPPSAGQIRVAERRPTRSKLRPPRGERAGSRPYTEAGRPWPAPVLVALLAV